MSRHWLTICLTLLALLASPPGRCAEIYRWVDEAGQVHYEDRSENQAENGVRSYTPPSPAGPPPEQRMETTRKLLNAYEVERQQARERKAEQEKIDSQRRRKCAVARDDLRRYQSYGRFYRLDDEGNRTYLSDEERAASLTRVQQRIARYCN